MQGVTITSGLKLKESQAQETIEDTGADMGISIDPLGAVGSVLGYQSAADDREQARALSNRDYWENRRRDMRDFENTQMWTNIFRKDAKRKVQDTVRDARKAGISPMAAMGAGGAQPASINLPSTPMLAGRTGGRYQRNLSNIMKVQFDLDNQQRQANTKKTNNEADYAYWKARMAEDEWTINRYKYSTGRGAATEMFIPLTDNSGQLRDIYGNDVKMGLNPDVGMEYPETVGGYYWLKENTPTIEGNIVK